MSGIYSNLVASMGNQRAADAWKACLFWQRLYDRTADELDYEMDRRLNAEHRWDMSANRVMKLEQDIRDANALRQIQAERIEILEAERAVLIESYAFKTSQASYFANKTVEVLEHRFLQIYVEGALFFIFAWGLVLAAL